ncbi:hypothetical protein EON67_09760 [archaeon]|nr:MAG: hypothetical protein EON67_09760 [archaeon]
MSVHKQCSAHDCYLDVCAARAVVLQVHLFDCDHPDVMLKESGYTRAGHELVAVDTPLGRLGLSTCYDLRFPSMYQQLVQVGGAQVLAVPSAFTVPTGLCTHARARTSTEMACRHAPYSPHTVRAPRTARASLSTDPVGVHACRLRALGGAAARARHRNAVLRGGSCASGSPQCGAHIVRSRMRD